MPIGAAPTWADLSQQTGASLKIAQEDAARETEMLFQLADADAVKGSYISKAVTWGHGKRRSLGAHAGRALRLRVALADAELYSVTFRCSAQ